jgi:ribose transport system substrate-binding protein
MHVGRRTRRAIPLGLLAVIALVVALVAGGSGSAGATSNASAAASTCGKAPVGKPPALLSSLPAQTKAYYNGYADALGKSQWAKFKPKHGGKFTVGVSFTALFNPFNAGLYKTLNQKLKANKGIGKVIAFTAASPGDVAGQVAQFQSLIQSKVDIIITLAASGPAFVPAIKQAAAAGIPTISLINDVATPGAISISPNPYQNYAPATAAILNQIGQKGNVVYVQGIPGTATDTAGLKVTKQLVAACPKVKLVGQVVGQYIPPVTTSALLAFLTTHPQPVAAVFQTGAMTPYIMAAFPKNGRKIPPVADIGAQVGSIAYWHDTKGYKSAGTAGGDTGLAVEAVDVTSRVLGGQGPKFTNVLWYQPQITQKNLNTFYKAGTKSTDAGTVENPASTYLPKSVMDSLFTNPKKKPVG